MCTCTVTNSLVLDNVFMLERFQDLNFPFEVSDVLCSAVLQFLHCDDLSRVVLKGVISTHLHAAKVPLKEKNHTS